MFHGRDAGVPSGAWDVIVVGAGIYGLPVAFFLARRGVRVLVLEDNAIPGECITVNTGGIIRIAYSDLDVARVAAFARRLYTRPTETLGLATPVSLGFLNTGWGRFVNADAEAHVFSTNVNLKGAVSRHQNCTLDFPAGAGVAAGRFWAKIKCAAEAGGDTCAIDAQIHVENCAQQ